MLRVPAATERGLVFEQLPVLAGSLLSHALHVGENLSVTCAADATVRCACRLRSVACRCDH